MTHEILWTPAPDYGASSQLARFANIIGLEPSFTRLHEHALRRPLQFWAQALDALEIRTHGNRSETFRFPHPADHHSPRAEWFPGLKINFAENLVRNFGSTPSTSASKLAPNTKLLSTSDELVIFRGEAALRRVVRVDDFVSQSKRIAHLLRELDIQPGDRCAAIAANCPETLISMVAAAQRGAVWSSCSPDFGVTGILDRFEQISPTVLFASVGYYWKGAWIDCREKIAQVLRSLPTVRALILLPYRPEDFDHGALDGVAVPTFNWNRASDRPCDHSYELRGFNDPQYIMFSSGTTGKPKCIVHSIGGTLLEHLKELVLHTDLRPSERFLYHTTCGWMMWNWMASGLAVGSSLVLYDGSPLEQRSRVLFDIVAEEGVSVFGTSSKFIALAEKDGVSTRSEPLPRLRTILSTGSPLLPESFDYIYREIKSDVCLSSIAGGTDIIGCFTLGNPWAPVIRGATQGPSLGLDVQVWSDQGQRLYNAKGELVCVGQFPSMPIGFFGDDQLHTRFRKAYFERFPGAWHHGDYVAENDHGGIVYYGRSDAVLNPGGVRIGTAEIYRQVERIEQVSEAVVVGQDFEGDVRVVLFVKLRPGITLDESLRKEIMTTIRQHASPFHVPKVIKQVSDIPRTRSGKIAELAVRDTLAGKPINNTEALANPESLEQFRSV